MAADILLVQKDFSRRRTNLRFAKFAKNTKFLIFFVSFVALRVFVREKKGDYHLKIKE
jgi:hypothetical protein